jgi:hypothetical protein
MGLARSDQGSREFHALSLASVSLFLLITTNHTCPPVSFKCFFFVSRILIYLMKRSFHRSEKGLEQKKNTPIKCIKFSKTRSSFRLRFGNNRRGGR